MKYNLELELAHRAATEVKEENEALKKAIEELLSPTRILRSLPRLLKKLF